MLSFNFNGYYLTIVKAATLLVWVWLSVSFWSTVITFRANDVLIELPNVITASGNTMFKTNDMTIESDRFSFNDTTQQGAFSDNVIIKKNNATLSGDYFTIHHPNRYITGQQNIRLITNELDASSDQLVIEDFENVRLLERVLIKQNGSQINSDELIYNMKTDTIVSDKRVKLIINK